MKVLRKLNPTRLEVTEAREEIEAEVRNALLWEQGIIQEIYMSIVQHPEPGPCCRPYEETLLIEIRRVRS